MTLGRITLAAASVAAMAVSGTQLWSLWRTGQPLFRGRRAHMRPNHPLAFALDIVSNAVVLAASTALLVWAFTG